MENHENDPESKERPRLYYIMIGCLILNVSVLLFFGIAMAPRLFSIGGWPLFGGTDINERIKMNRVMEIIEDEYLYDADPDLIETGKYKGIAAGLDDPYAAYYSPEEFKQILESNEGEYFGIGITIAETEGNDMVVVNVTKGGPAELAGIEPGDIITEMNGESLKGRSSADIATEIRAQKDPFKLTVKKAASDDTVVVDIQCAEVETAKIEYEMKENHIGYMHLNEFSSNTPDQFREAADSLKKDGMEKLLIDLRGNPGGLLHSVCDLLDELISDGNLVYTEDKKGNRTEYGAKNEVSINCPVAVLIDRDSASASEIFAGAVQDYKLGPVIGEKSFGKGIVQNTYPLIDGSAFKLTIEKYYTPMGQDIQGNGITPDHLLDTMLDENGNPKDTKERDEEAELAEALTYFEEWDAAADLERTGE